MVWYLEILASRTKVNIHFGSYQILHLNSFNILCSGNKVGSLVFDGEGAINSFDRELHFAFSLSDCFLLVELKASFPSNPSAPSYSSIIDVNKGDFMCFGNVTARFSNAFDGSPTQVLIQNIRRGDKRVPLLWECYSLFL